MTKKQTLQQYIKTRKAYLTIGEFAKRLDITREHLSRILWGKVRASFALAKRIEKETCGAVTWESVLELRPK